VGGAWVTTYDGWREAVEHTVVPSSPAQMVPVKQFVHGSDLDEILAYRRFNGTSWEDYHILHGGQDTAAKLVNQSGQVVEQYEYDPFGKATVYTAAGALVDVGPAGTSPEDGTRSAYGLTHLYKAMRLDPETGNCYVRNRFYDPRTGRFMSRDPIGVWGDGGNMGNEYAYAWNRPLVVGDRLGLQSGLDLFEQPSAGGGSPTSGGKPSAEDIAQMASHMASQRNSCVACHPPNRKSPPLTEQVRIPNWVSASLRMAGGTLECAWGVAFAMGTAVTGVGAAGGVLVALHGLDQVIAGARSLGSGRPEESVTEMALEKAGVPKAGARWIDAGISVVGTMGTSAISTAPRIAAAGAEPAAQGMSTLQVLNAYDRGSRALNAADFAAMGANATSAIAKANMMARGVDCLGRSYSLTTTWWQRAVISVKLAPTGLTPGADIGMSVIGAGASLGAASTQGR
jgi:RHS repeat-associated protein